MGLVTLVSDSMTTQYTGGGVEREKRRRTKRRRGGIDEDEEAEESRSVRAADRSVGGTGQVPLTASGLRQVVQRRCVWKEIS
ncbi:hypothetical protein GW17_00062311 [Ensete ventricosum]|nr:hypothetical protein GW17_00062311 [Ensete ventricosum]